MSQKRIVLTGHGAWDPKSTPRPFTTLPGNCSMHFYTENFALMSEAFGQELEAGHSPKTPDQTAGPYQMVPNMVLTWPRRLTVTNPPLGRWHSIAWAPGVPIPVDEKNILFHIKEPDHPLPDLLADPLGHMFVDEILAVLEPAIRLSESVLIVWSACRQVMLEKVGRREVLKRRVEWDEADANKLRDELAKTGFTLTPEARNHLRTLDGQLITLDAFIRATGVRAWVLAQANPQEAWREAKRVIGKASRRLLETTPDPITQRSYDWLEEKQEAGLNARDEHGQLIAGRTG